MYLEVYLYVLSFKRRETILNDAKRVLNDAKRVLRMTLNVLIEH